MVKNKKTENKRLKYNLACGQIKMEGYAGVDKVKNEFVDIVYDLERFPWTFAKDNSVDEIICNHYIEHTEDLIKFIDECHRILKKDGKVSIVAPYYSSARAWQDPTHKRAICEATFLYFNKGWRKQNKLDHYDIKSDFDFSYGYAINPDWATRSEETRNFAIKHYINVVSDIQVVLTKKEDK